MKISDPASTKILVAAPGTPDLMVEGFDELEITGDPRATLAAAGIDPDRLGEGYDPRGEGFFDYDAFLHMLTHGAGVPPRVHGSYGR